MATARHPDAAPGSDPPAAPSTAASAPAAAPLSGPARALQRLGLTTPVALALHLPMRYEDETRVVPLAQALPGQTVQVEGEVRDSRVELRPRRQLVVTLADDAGDTGRTKGAAPGAAAAATAAAAASAAADSNRAAGRVGAPSSARSPGGVGEPNMDHAVALPLLFRAPGAAASLALDASATPAGAAVAASTGGAGPAPGTSTPPPKPPRGAPDDPMSKQPRHEPVRPPPGAAGARGRAG